MSTTLKAWLWVALVVGLLILTGYGLHALHQNGIEQGKATVQLQWDKAKAQQAQDQLVREQQARAREQTLTANMAQLEQKAQDEKHTSDARLRDVLDELRNRPKRPERTPAQLAGGLPQTTPTGAGCTGAQLARDDAEFLARYAFDAQRLQTALEQCTAAYEAARGAQ